jgi:hypothetical protein
MLLSESQVAIEGCELCPGTVVRIGLRQPGSIVGSFWAIIKLKTVDGAEICARISVFDLDLRTLPSRLEWIQACDIHDFSGDYMEYVLKSLQDRSALKVLFRSLSHGVAIELTVCDQIAYGLLKPEFLAGDRYFLIPESALVLAK